jgi:hypothetical protein
MTRLSVAYLLAPCILFTSMAGCAVIYGTDYANTPQEEYVVKRHRKDAELRQIVAANIAAGDPFPSRELMLAELDARDERTKAMEGTAAACGWSMRRIGFGVLFGVVAQFYVVLRLRAHYQKLAGGATAPSQSGISP